MTLEQFARFLAARYGAPVWLVGSASRDPTTARDVDVRVILREADFASRYGAVSDWNAGNLSQLLLDDLAHWGREGVRWTGANLDLQIYPAQYAEQAFPEAERTLLAVPRVRNWDLALLDFKHQLRGEPLVWGETDCVSLIRRAWAVVFGEDLIGHMPHWTTALGAAKAQKQTGGLRAVMLEHGARELALNFAQTGDAVVGPAEEGHDFPFAGLVVGPDVVTATVEDGVITHPLQLAPEGSTAMRWHDGP